MSTSSEEMDVDMNDLDSKEQNAGGKYEWLSVRDHAWKRPDSYLGPIPVTEISRHVFRCAPLPEDTSETIKSPVKLATELVSYQASPALFKFWDEIVVNAFDNSCRDPKQKHIHLRIGNDGVFTVSNDGDSIPIEKWNNSDRYIIEILFVELMSGENFDDSKKRKGGGKNGVGAALVNLFSKWMKVQVVSDKEKYTQHFENNSSVIHPPKIVPSKKSDSKGISVTWLPDYDRIGMKATEVSHNDLLSLLKMRAYDIAACSRKNLTVTFNGENVGIKTLSDYANVFDTVIVKDVCGDDDAGCEFCLLSTSVCIGFVNGVRCCYGTLVDAIYKDIADKFSTVFSKKYKRPIVIKPSQVRDQIGLIVKSTISNPDFASQTKEKFTTRREDFGFTLTLSNKVWNAIEKSNAYISLQGVLQKEEDKSIQKSVKSDRGTLLKSTKYERATKLGGKTPCTLYVTEGDSAKGLAVAGFSVIGREHNGVFPLRGKLVNVNGMTPRRALENTEVKTLLQILKLDPNVTYDRAAVEKLSYRHLMIFVDQDDDGSHIMGLILNVFHTFFPSLLRECPDYLYRFATPLLKAVSQGSKHSFFSLPDFEAWKQNQTHKIQSVQYFKGLGTSSNADAKEYFSNLQSHCINVLYTPECGDKLDLFFASNRSDDRKKMLEYVDKTLSVDYNQKTLTVKDFCEKDLIRFSVADNIRSIPDMIDGLKPAQRKVLDVALKHKTLEMKVAQLASSVADITNYHHGETSLAGVIVGMAQPWIGLNNIAFLKPMGQYGSRHNPKSAAAPRYIFTQAHSITRSLFPKADDPILTPAIEDGQEVEPVRFLPILPTVLFNGVDGIGTGWRSWLPNFSPLDVCKCVKDVLNGNTCDDLQPYYFGFKGRMYPDPPGQFQVFIFEAEFTVENDTLIISDLPPQKWTQTYKDWLADHRSNDILSIDDNSTDEFVLLHIKCRPGFLASCKNIVTHFALSNKISLTNSVLFDPSGRLKRYTFVKDIIEEFVAYRLPFYDKRLRYQCDALEHQLKIAKSKCKLIKEVDDEILVLKGMTTDQLRNYFATHNYYDYEKFEYLTRMPIASITIDLHNKLIQECKTLEQNLENLKKITAKEAWFTDLDDFEKTYEKYIEERTEAMTAVSKKDSKKKANGGKKRAR